MIFDNLVNAKRYYNTHPLFTQAFRFLKSKAHLKTGRYNLRNGIYVIVQNVKGKGPKASTLEAHRTYIDIQLTIKGRDLIGWKPLSKCRKIKTQYNRQNDIEFYSEKPDFWLTLTPGNFAIFFPEDTHAPLALTGKAQKIVVKIPA